MEEWKASIHPSNHPSKGARFFLKLAGEIARENVAAVLAERVVDGPCNIDEAEQTAKLIFHDNAWNTFRFENWKGR